MSSLKNLTGRKFGKLTVIKIDEERNKIEKNRFKNGEIKRNGIYWVCQCECGNKKSVERNLLYNGKVKSCGCLQIESRYLNKKYNKYDLTGEYGIGWTSNTNEEFYFDLEDYDKIKDYTWYKNTQEYVVTCVKNKKIIRLHRLVMNLDEYNKDIEVDHIFHNTLDSRKENLRICTHMENSLNRKNLNNDKIIGVNFSIDRNKWSARLRYNKKDIYLGRYINKEDAIIARLKAEKEYFGEFAPQKHLFEKYMIGD